MPMATPLDNDGSRKGEEPVELTLEDMDSVAGGVGLQRVFDGCGPGSQASASRKSPVSGIEVAVAGFGPCDSGSPVAGFGPCDEGT